MTRKIKMAICKYVYKTIISQSDHAGCYDWFMRHNGNTSCPSCIPFCQWFGLYFCGAVGPCPLWNHKVLWQLAGKGLWISIWDNKGEREGIKDEICGCETGCPAVGHLSPHWPLLSEVNLGLIAEP